MRSAQSGEDGGLSSMKTMHTELKIGDRVVIGQSAITLEYKSGRIARLLIVASDGVPIRKIPCVGRP